MDRFFRYCGLVAQAVLIITFFGVALSGYIYVSFEVTRTLWRYDQEKKWGYLEAFPKALPFTVLSIYLDESAMALFPYYLRLAGVKSKRARLVYPVVNLVASVVCWWVGYLPNFDCRAIGNLLLLRMDTLNERIRQRDRDSSSVPIIDEPGLSHIRIDSRVIDKKRNSEELTFEYIATLLGGLHFSMDYPYTPLTQPRSVRILTLEPSSTFDAPLICQLSEFTLDEAPSFTALSYAWDVAGGSTHVLCELFRLKVTRNCARALHRIRDRDGKEESIRLWVDAICIDQGDSDEAKAERTQQIQIMGEVYKRASRVVAWIGEHERSSGYVCDIMTAVGETFVASHDDTVAWEKAESVAFRKARQWIMFTDCWREFFERSWFTRMWPIQEVALPLPGRVVLSCGDTMIPWEYVRISWQVLAGMGIMIGSFKLDQAVALQFYLSDAVALKRNEPDEAKRRIGRPLIQDLSEVSLTSIMQATRFKACSLAKDKFFALYGILQELGISHKVKVVKYATMTEAEVYLQVFLSCFVNDKSFDALRCARTAEHYTGHNEFWMARPEPYDSFANILFSSIANISSAWQRSGREPAPLWRANFPSWVPDWCQSVYSDAEDRDIALIYAHTINMGRRENDRAPTIARPRTRLKNLRSPPTFLKLRQRQSRVADGNGPDIQQGLILQVQGKIIGVVKSVGSVDSFALLWQSFGTFCGFYNWRRHWRASLADQKITHEPYFVSTTDAYVAAMIETSRNFLVNSTFAQIMLSLKMLYRALDWKAFLKYANATVWTWILLPYLRSGVCGLHPAVSLCQKDTPKNTHSFLVYGIPILIWILFPNANSSGRLPRALKHASPLLVFSATALMWQLRGSIYTTMYGEARWAKSQGVFEVAFSVMWVGQLISLIAGYYEDDILVLVARIAMSLVIPVHAVEMLLYTYLSNAALVICTITAVAACRCVQGTWQEIRGSSAFRRQGTFTSGLNFFSTETALTGSTSAPVRLFDVVVLIDWASDPMVLRKTGVVYEVVGAAYIGDKSREELENSVDGWEPIRIR
ncbi:heterokaryon incompatibility protein-domain-containing protein [Lophiotrema nucula]|uniref:Heterokaryon incompatibility protein-domain-containing protein n=1 Tax=Lophiotrema nucula TaxID=690887 RepID=A0A6A5ZT49_9PLEO|nr:heterokaryon incompatibility protein-domain-containing protein [Lophiotrema nucula]